MQPSLKRTSISPAACRAAWPGIRSALQPPWPIWSEVCTWLEVEDLGRLLRTDRYMHAHLLADRSVFLAVVHHSFGPVEQLLTEEQRATVATVRDRLRSLVLGVRVEERWLARPTVTADGVDSGVSHTISVAGRAAEGCWTWARRYVTRRVAREPAFGAVIARNLSSVWHVLPASPAPQADAGVIAAGSASLPLRVVRLLLECKVPAELAPADVDAVEADTLWRYQPLFRAIFEQQPDLARLLLDAGACPYKAHALFTAVAEGQIGMARLLLERKVLPDHPVAGTAPPIALACMLGYAQTADLLLRHQADVHGTPHPDALAPVVMAATGHRIDAAMECIRVLLRHKADINQCRGRTVLMQAVAPGNARTGVRSEQQLRPLVEFLLANRADPTITAPCPSGEQWNAAQVAGAAGHAQLASLIESAASSETP